MSQFSLFFNSKTDGRGQPKSHDFLVNLSSAPLILDGQWEASLSSASLIFAFHNITVILVNNTFDYFNGVITQTITFVDGQYDIFQLQSFVEAELISNGDFAGPPATAPFQFLTDETTGKVQININTAGFTVDLTTSDLHLLLGFDSIVVAVTQQGSGPANLNNGITSLLIHCSLVQGSIGINAASSDTMAQIPIVSKPFAPINYEAFNLNWLPVKSASAISQIRVRLTDDQSRSDPVDLRGEPFSIFLNVRKARNF